MLRKYEVIDNFFQEINSEIKAYLLGFFLADGTYSLGARCTNSYKFQIRLQHEDVNVINMYQQEIVPTKPIINHPAYVDKNNVVHKETNSSTWTSKLMGQHLQEYNIYPQKTYDLNFTFPFEKIPLEYLWDFIRGFFDGDRQISYSNKTHQSTFALYGTSYDFMHQLGELFEKEFDVQMRIEGIQKSKMMLYTLRFHSNFKRKTFIENLYIKFYKNKNYFLKRKQEKFLNYLLFKYRDNLEDYERLLSIVERRE